MTVAQAVCEREPFEFEHEHRCRGAGARMSGPIDVLVATFLKPVGLYYSTARVERDVYVDVRATESWLARDPHHRAAERKMAHPAVTDHPDSEREGRGAGPLQ